MPPKKAKAVSQPPTASTKPHVLIDGPADPNIMSAFQVARGNEYDLVIVCRTAQDTGICVTVQVDPPAGVDKRNAVTGLVTKFNLNSTIHVQRLALGNLLVPGIHRLTPRFRYFDADPNQIQFTLYRAREDGQKPGENDIPIYSVGSSTEDAHLDTLLEDSWRELPSFLFVLQ